MPTYDYRCNECGHTFEEFQSMSSPQLVNCPNCGKPALKRMMGSGAGMIFKGSGFYLTDYKSSSVSTDSKSESKKAENKGENKNEKKDAKKEVKKESNSESKSDSKPASPPPPAADSKS